MSETAQTATSKTELYSFTAKDPTTSKERKFIISKPSRRLKQDGELYYSAQLSKLVSAGVLPRIVWEKFISNSDGIVSNQEQQRVIGLIESIAEKQVTIKSIVDKPEEERTQEEKNILEEVEKDYKETEDELRAIEVSKTSLYENCAEAKARNRTILWWTCFLAHEEKDSKLVPVLGINDIESRLDKYEDISENDEFLFSVLRRIGYLITAWYVGAADDSGAFSRIDAKYLEDFSTAEVPAEASSPEVASAPSPETSTPETAEQTATA